MCECTVNTTALCTEVVKPAALHCTPPLPAVWISLYYVAFYVVMTAIFALCIYTLMCTIDPYTPDYQDQLKSPGKGGSCPDPRTQCVRPHAVQEPRAQNTDPQEQSPERQSRGATHARAQGSEGDTLPSLLGPQGSEGGHPPTRAPGL